MRKQTILLLSLLLLVVLGGFYAQPLSAKEDSLRIDIETTSGDDAALEGLTYYGTASNQWETIDAQLRQFRLAPFRNASDRMCSFRITQTAPYWHGVPTTVPLCAARVPSQEIMQRRKTICIMQ